MSITKERKRFRALASGCIMLLASSIVVPVSAQNAADLRRAERLFDEGTAAFESGEYDQALDKMRRSFELSKNYRSAAGLGQVELHLGRYRDAAQHLDYSLRSFPTTADARGKRRVMAGLAEARRHTFSLAVRANVEGAEVSVDGRVLGTTPVDHDLYISPGEHVLRVQLAGYSAFERQLFGPAGGQKEVVVDLVPENAAPRDASAQSRSLSPSAWVLVAGGALTVGAAAGGLALKLSADSEDERAEKLDAELEARDLQCRGSSVPECDQLREARENADGRASWATAMWLTAAASAVTTATVFAWLNSQDEETTPTESLALRPVLNPHGTSLLLSGKF